MCGNFVRKVTKISLSTNCHEFEQRNDYFCFLVRMGTACAHTITPYAVYSNDEAIIVRLSDHCFCQFLIYFFLAVHTPVCARWTCVSAAALQRCRGEYNEVEFNVSGRETHTKQFNNGKNIVFSFFFHFFSFSSLSSKNIPTHSLTHSLTLCTNRFAFDEIVNCAEWHCNTRNRNKQEKKNEEKKKKKKGETMESRMKSATQTYHTNGYIITFVFFWMLSSLLHAK